MGEFQSYSIHGYLLEKNKKKKRKSLNHFNKYLNIFYASDQLESASLYNINGLVVKNVSFREKAQLSMVDLDAGLYFLRIGNDVKKIVVE